jgi:hypothetical protein
MSVAEYVTTIQSYPQETFQGHCGLFSVTKFVTVHDLVRMSDNIAQTLEVKEVAAAAVVNDVHFKGLWQSLTRGGCMY